MTAETPRGTRPVTAPNDVFAQYRNTPIESLLLAQNLGREFATPARANLVVATCIDPRIDLRLPTGSAFVIRTAGVNLKHLGMFQFAFPTSVVGIRHVALIAHEDCAMVGLHEKRQVFVDGLMERTGCGAESATRFFEAHADFWGVDDAIAVVRDHARKIEGSGDLVVAPLYYTLSDKRLLQVE